MNWKKKWLVHIRKSKFRLETLLTRFNYIIAIMLAWLIPVTVTVAAGIAIYDIGFNPFYSIERQRWVFFHWLIVILSALLLIRFIQSLVLREPKTQIIIHSILALGFLYIAFTSSFFVLNSNSPSQDLLVAKGVQYGIVFLLSFIELSKIAGNVYRHGVNPSLVFVLSFLGIILLGTTLLLLPRSTLSGLSVVDAFFMSTSAVCVTGLTTVSLTNFTFLGQLIILILIQIGGLGVMTFAGLLGHSVSGKATFQSQLALRDMVSSQQLSKAVQTVYTIIGVTLLFELVGMFLLYTSLNESHFATEGEKIYFSIFHSISAFCNAGFSTLPDGMATPLIVGNLKAQWVLIILIILGGMGFPIVFNLYKYLLHHIKNLFGFLFLKRRKQYVTRIVNLTSQIALQTTIFLLLFGFGIYLLAEAGHSITPEMPWFEKITKAFFGSVTARTAGFHMVDFNTLQLPTLLVIILLMWIGASPSSTGGGIKTTTIAVAILNMASIIKGKDRTEFKRREIGSNSIRRAFAIILLSLVFIGLCTVGIAIEDGDKGLLKIVFESFSAFSTVGISLGITAELSALSKVILMATMFLGRVGTLTLLAAIIRQSSQLDYRYPSEEVLI
jgi:Trk-type K+ transport system membrane component